MNKPLIYVSGCYTVGSIPENIEKARKVAIELWRRGYAVICPHTNTAYFESDLPDAYEDFIAGDLKMIERCDGVVMLLGWALSPGAKRELAHAQQQNIPVFYQAPSGPNALPLGPEAWPPRRQYVPPAPVGQLSDFGEKLAAEQANRVRTFNGGATRDLDTDKYDYEAFLSPKVLERFAAYMHKHRKQADGSLRAGDNWQKGMPQAVFVKSLWRHFMDVWKLHRAGTSQLDAVTRRPQLQEALCAVMFNAMGLLHEVLIGRSVPEPPTREQLHEDKMPHGDYTEPRS